MSAEGNIGAGKCLLGYERAAGAANRVMVGGLVSASAQATTVASGLASIDSVMVCLAEDHTANCDGISAVISGTNIIVDQWNDGAAASTGFLDFHWWAIGEAA